ncbi:MAG: LacI family DNA-binding transcriptional regulator [Balneolales bacterium]
MSSNVTLKQIALKLDLSTMTVSRALNNPSMVGKSTRQKVLEAAKSMGYSPNHIAKSLVSRKTFTLGVIIPQISHSFFPEIVRGIEEIAYDGNYQLLLTQSAESFEKEVKNIETLRSKRVDGILVSSAQTIVDYKYYKRVINAGLPFVFFDRCVEDIGASCVSVNDRTSSRRITQHLIDHGYEKIAHLSGPQKVTIGYERSEGYKEALSKNGLPVNPKWIVENGFNEKGGYEAMKKILDLPADEHPRAVVAVNDPVAFGAMEAIRDYGLSIPDDIAIVGFSDDIRAKLMPCPLTTVFQPAYEVGKKAAEKLLKIIDHVNEPIENIEVITQNRIRESCGCNSKN